MTRDEAIATCYTTREVATTCGLSPRQLQWWDETGVVVPAQFGHRRYYTIEQVMELYILVRLRNSGMSLQDARKAVNAYQDYLRSNTDQDGHLSPEHRVGYLIISVKSKEVSRCGSADTACKVMAAYSEPFYVVYLSEVMLAASRLRDRVQSLRPAPSRPSNVA